MTERITIGLMSGTSLDGTDAVAMAFDGRVMRSLGHSSLAFPPNLRAALAALTLPGWQHFTAVRPTKLLHRLPATKLF